MSAALRQAAEKLAAKYCRVFCVYRDAVTARYFDANGIEDAEIWADDRPTWTVGTSEVTT